MKEPKRVCHAIIGCGRVAPNHVDGFQAAKLSEVKWACDRDAQTAKEFAQNYQISCITTDYHVALADPELTSVSVTVDHEQHAAIVRDALQAGKHVLVEKPLALSIEEALDIANLARVKSLILAVVSQHRYDPLLIQVKKMLDEGTLGHLVSIWTSLQCSREPEYYSDSYWRGTWHGEGGSVLINQGYHYIDLMLWLGGAIHSVSAMMGTIKLADVIETEDTLCGILRFDNGALGSLSITSGSAVFWRSRIDVVGTKGSLRFDIDHPDTLHFYRLSADAEKELEEFLESDKLEHLPPPGRDYYGISHRFQISEFVEAISKEGVVRVDGFEALRTLRTILDLYNAARSLQATQS